MTRRIAAITGGGSGLGKAFAARWVRDGGRAVLLDLSKENIDSAVTELGAENVRGVITDVTNATSVNTAMKSIQDREGGLDALLNGAGIGRPARSSEVSDEDFSLLLDIHLVGTLRASRAAYSLLKISRGAIVNIGSVGARLGLPGRASYCSAKAGIEGLTRTLAVEWAPEGIRVNSVNPGYVRTALTEAQIESGQLHPSPIEARTPLGRFGLPEEIAGPINFLFSQEASFITGHSLYVDGGLTVDGNWY